MLRALWHHVLAHAFGQPLLAVLILVAVVLNLGLVVVLAVLLLTERTDLPTAPLPPVEPAPAPIPDGAIFVPLDQIPPPTADDVRRAFARHPRPDPE